MEVPAEKKYNTFIKTFYQNEIIDLRLWNEPPFGEITYNLEHKVIYPVSKSKISSKSALRERRGFAERINLTVLPIYTPIDPRLVIKSSVTPEISKFYVSLRELTKYMYKPYVVLLEIKSDSSFKYLSWPDTKVNDYEPADRLTPCKHILDMYLDLGDEAVAIYHNDFDRGWRDERDDQKFSNYLKHFTLIREHLSGEVDVKILNQQLLDAGFGAQIHGDNVKLRTEDLLRTVELTPCPPYPTMEEFDLMKSNIKIMIIFTSGGFWVISKIDFTIVNGGQVSSEIIIKLYDLLYIKTVEQNRHGPVGYREVKNLTKELEAINQYLQLANLNLKYFSFKNLPARVALDPRYQKEVSESVQGS